MGNRSGRSGKLVTAGHQTFVEGLKEFVAVLEKWDEIETIRTGRLAHGKAVNQTGSHKYSGGPDKARGTGMGGGFSFHATRWARIGQVITGIKCTASFGRLHQEVVLTSSNYPALRARLVREGYLEE